MNGKDNISPSVLRRWSWPKVSEMHSKICHEFCRMLTKSVLRTFAHRPYAQYQIYYRLYKLSFFSLNRSQYVDGYVERQSNQSITYDCHRWLDQLDILRICYKWVLLTTFFNCMFVPMSPSGTFWYDTKQLCGEPLRDSQFPELFLDKYMP